MKNLWKVAAWIGVSAAVTMSIYITGSGWWLLFLLIPAAASAKDEK